MGNCWYWVSSKTINGYGQFSLNGKTKLAHRLSYEHFKEKIPKELQINHICRTRHCVNPDHLEAITQQENIGKGLGGINNRIKTHCPQGHEYSKENTQIRPNGKRNCRICHRIGSNQYNQRKKLGVIIS